MMALVVVPVLLTSCATPQPPQAFYSTDDAALVIKSLDEGTSQILRPLSTGRENNDILLAKAMTLPQRQTAVVIMENYTEPRIGEQFRGRGTAWFVGLRHLGYQHIVFVQGMGGNSPEGLLTLAEYN
jgi:hypothetical protein